MGQGGVGYTPPPPPSPATPTALYILARKPTAMSDASIPVIAKPQYRTPVIYKSEYSMPVIDKLLECSEPWFLSLKMVYLWFLRLLVAKLGTYNPCLKLIFPNLIIGHFTVVCSVSWPLNGSKVQGDHLLIQTLLLLFCKSSCSDAN